MDHIRLALDWTPNINHIGFFIAQQKGFYQEQGIEVTLTNPADDNYQMTPAKKVELGQADLALCPTESVISYRTKPEPFDMIAIGTIFQKDLSTIAVKADSGIQQPADLDGKSYASYQARYEDEIVKEMIRNDGGLGNIEVVYPEKLGIWETIVNGKYDATWIFVNWEGVEAKSQGIDLQLFRMEDYQVPYSYSPVMAGSEKRIMQNADAYVRFLRASKAGFLYAQTEPEEAVTLLKPFVPEGDAGIDLHAALAQSANAFGTNANWGKMNPAIVGNFLNWLNQKGLERQALALSDLMTSELIDQLD